MYLLTSYIHSIVGYILHYYVNPYISIFVIIFALSYPPVKALSNLAQPNFTPGNPFIIETHTNTAIINLKIFFKNQKVIRKNMFFYAEKKIFCYKHKKKIPLSPIQILEILPVSVYIKTRNNFSKWRLKINFTTDVVYTCFDSGDIFYILLCFNVTWFSHKQWSQQDFR